MVQHPGWCVVCLLTCEAHAYFRELSPMFKISNGGYTMQYAVWSSTESFDTPISTNHLCNLCCDHQIDSPDAAAPSPSLVKWEMTSGRSSLCNSPFCGPSLLIFSGGLWRNGCRAVFVS
ncbi:uncharacterized protein LOC133177051 [Saccostrea echinata]|uniref:uncharacterized protein LOC133177051 n=1 Tax=Saccostrea echinata TaxID=191078 RepID=UPI002A83DE2D|nr:uncharacterized protein LOC133177051 [Saccostrea echinata]